MAMSIVAVVVGKLWDMAAKEGELLGEVKKQVEKMERELKQNWLNELRDVAYRIDDAVDTFHVELENCKKDRSSWDKVKKLGRKVKELPILHKFGKELADIQNLLDEISKSKNDYAIAPLQNQEDGGSSDTIIMPKRRTAYQDVNETEIVGLESHKNNILNLLCPEKTARRVVITIVGPGGLGKTTLARMVYKSAKVNFDFHIMLSVSQQFNRIDLARKMLSELEKSKPQELRSSEPKEEEDIISEIKNLLSSRTYLIILDDVWKVEVWDQLSIALPDNKNGSRVLITSRSINVAQSADSKMTRYELAFLEKKESFDLFLKKALPYRELDEECPSYLCEVAHALSEKCKGLPLALILGGLVSCRGETYHEWNKVLETMNWHEEGKECMKILDMSYKDMPYHLKDCFLYLASFPEDYKISARRLIRMWVAEKLIPHDEKKTMELKAEECLEQLVHRSMIQVSSRHSIGSIKSCQLHDLLRDLAMHHAEKENFVTVLPKPQGVNHAHKVIRRASLQSKDCREFINYVDKNKNTRSLLCFGLALEMVKFRLLRVVEIENAGITIAGLDGISRPWIFDKFSFFNEMGGNSGLI
ncbi:Disease resistance protein RPP8 [Rhynchospora pubera]|uniref:Disease resistance protein RPP8 n=1 Tax=Rhynchospora pubera TaxID=906938 RepID=A0AAV8BRZ8_9POAL|nr:Disease resistance protein RPP8 [Rhynchospora pubera]